MHTHIYFNLHRIVIYFLIIIQYEQKHRLLHDLQLKGKAIA
jgi:hypothetical protein